MQSTAQPAEVLARLAAENLQRLGEERPANMSRRRFVCLQLNSLIITILTFVSIISFWILSRVETMAVRARATMRRQLAAAAALARKEDLNGDKEEEIVNDSVYEATNAPSLQVNIEAFSRELVLYNPYAVVKVANR